MKFEKFDARFHACYDYLYDNAGDKRVNQIIRRCTDTHDKLMKISKKYNVIACMYVKHRGDLLISDRECAAYVLATLHYTA